MTAPAQTARRGIPVLGPLSTTARIAVLVTVAISLAAIVLDFVLHANETLLFIVAAIAILGLAWIVGLSTERLGAISGPQVGGILNATFGNIAELIISFFALQAGYIEVVKASFNGSILVSLAPTPRCSCSRRSACSSRASSPRPPRNRRRAASSRNRCWWR